MLQLFYSGNSPYARKVRIVLREKGLQYQETAMDTAHPPPGFAQRNPNLRVPVLVDGEQALFESNIILDYLLKTYPGAGAGQPPLAAAMTRPDRHWEDSLTLNAIETLLDSGLNLFQMNKSGVPAQQAAYLRTEAQRMQSELDWLEQRATPEGFVPGVFSIQDLNLVCALNWVNFRKPIEWQGRPKLRAILERYQARPSVKATVPGQ
jgi:glutathione S-transferase